MTKQEKELEKIILPVTEKLGYELYDVEYVKEGQDWYVRLYIDSENGINLDDCEKVSDAVGEELDRVDPIATAYLLEVSSCGLERRLREKKHFETAIDKNVEIKLFKTVNKSKVITGILKEVTDAEILVCTDEDTEERISFDNISNAKILFDWEESENE
ncbi:MAG: ribosome maturation factor RimP [Clostridia bacterium]|nr:ribosome maturation factor RimP [Clostridia bacterium]